MCCKLVVLHGATEHGCGAHTTTWKTPTGELASQTLKSSLDGPGHVRLLCEETASGQTDRLLIPGQSLPVQLCFRPEGGVQALCRDPHRDGEIINRCALVAALPEQQGRLLHGFYGIEASWAATTSRYCFSNNHSDPLELPSTLTYFMSTHSVNQMEPCEGLT